MTTHSLDGIVQIGAYTSGTVATNLTELKALIPDPDSTSSSGAQAGGGNLDEMSPGAAAQLRVELAALIANGGGGGVSRYGSHVVTAGEVTATHADIVTGLADLTLSHGAVAIYRAGTNVTAVAGAGITEVSAGTLRIADSGTYVLTAGDVVNWFASA